MTEPTDAELIALLGDRQFSTIGAVREALRRWGTPPAVAKWAPEEIADGERGIRWVTNEGIHGRPTDHDVREYLKRTPTAHGCNCDECKQFYTTPHPNQAVPPAGREPLTDEQIARIYERYGGDMINCTRSIERHHGIKGGQHDGVATLRETVHQFLESDPS